MKTMQIAERLGELWDNRENIHAQLIDLMKRIEANGEFGEDEKQRLLSLKYESEAMTEALTEICKEAGV